jgi:hypothetical protein
MRCEVYHVHEACEEVWNKMERLYGYEEKHGQEDLECMVLHSYTQKPTQNPIYQVKVQKCGRRAL